jgi:hypothetical protein
MYQLGAKQSVTNRKRERVNSELNKSVEVSDDGDHRTPKRAGLGTSVESETELRGKVGIS